MPGEPCPTCGKVTYRFLHSCPNVRLSEADQQRLRDMLDKKHTPVNCWCGKSWDLR